MKRIIFYSWQSDRPNATNRGFIEKALLGAASKISSDDTINIDPVVDRDTAGLAGSPDISNAILEKISMADVFLADVSIVVRSHEGKLRASPNPNVLLELGYAARALGWDRVVMVANTEFGDIRDLPFDLRNRRVIPYALSERAAAEEKAETKRTLERRFVEALSSVLMTAPKGFGELQRSIELLQEELASNKRLTGRMASSPEHRHLDTVLKRVEDLEFDKRHPVLMTALRDQKRRTNELLAMSGYGGAANSIMKDKYIPAADTLERELRAFLENPECT